jgi:CHAT domain-containing protein
VHFAGHAVFDDQRPERSALVLAPARAGDTASASLAAGRIATLDQRRVRLVVLSACETVRAGTERASGFTGLAGAFLAAGVGGVIGTLWRVDDDATRTLLVAFHHELARTGDPPSALRAAQLRLLRGPEGRWRAPTAWAAVRYVGR